MFSKENLNLSSFMHTGLVQSILTISVHIYFMSWYYKDTDATVCHYNYELSTGRLDVPVWRFNLGRIKCKGFFLSYQVSLGEHKCIDLIDFCV